MVSLHQTPGDGKRGTPGQPARGPVARAAFGADCAMVVAHQFGHLIAGRAATGVLPSPRAAGVGGPEAAR